MSPEQPTSKSQPTVPTDSFAYWRLRPVSLAILVVVTFLSVSAVTLLTQHSPKPSVAAIPPTATIHITSRGFQPATLLVKAGTAVVWINDDTHQTHVIASNPYPLDNSLSNLKSSQLGEDAQFSYTFAHTGSYDYHDDLNPTSNGTITVK